MNHRSFKVGGQNGDLRCVPPVRCPWGFGDETSQKLTKRFCENVPFCHGFKMHASLYELIQYDMKRKNQPGDRKVV